MAILRVVKPEALELDLSSLHVLDARGRLQHAHLAHQPADLLELGFLRHRRRLAALALNLLHKLLDRAHGGILEAQALGPGLLKLELPDRSKRRAGPHFVVPDSLRASPSSFFARELSSCSARV